jgi:hypothetical protein
MGGPFTLKVEGSLTRKGPIHHSSNIHVALYIYDLVLFGNVRYVALKHNLVQLLMHSVQRST